MNGAPSSELPRIIPVALRELCEFTCKRGDLDLRFTPSPTSQEGIAGHKVVSARRGSDHTREVRLESRYRSLHIKGRADGVRDAPASVEEVKTFRGDLARMPENHRSLHWAQLRMYGAQLCATRGLDTVNLELTYFNVDTQKEVTLTEDSTAEALQAFHDANCQSYLDWELQQQAHREARYTALTAAAFPHADFHAGQRQLAEAVYRASTRKRHLLAQAPTGIGKSIGTLFPALKAMAGGVIDKIFYLTAKTSGRAMALNAIAALKDEAGRPVLLRTLEMVAREKSCEHPDKACHGESCPLAKGFYDRLPAARAAAAELHCLDQAAIRTVALGHQVCPYYLSQEMVRWSDVVVGDYNYFFDQSALLYSLTIVNDWRVTVLVDEAHNLVERGRAMYSAELDQSAVRAAKAHAPAPIKKALTKLNSAWSKAMRDQVEIYKTYAQPPVAILEAVKKTATAMGSYFTEHPVEATGSLQRLYFDVLVFLQLAEQFGDHSLFDVQLSPTATGRAQQGSVLCVRNVVPAPFLQPRIQAASSVVAFSATLNPPHFYRDLLGLNDNTAWLDVPSPFIAEQLAVHVVDQISTRYQDRQQSVEPIVALMAQQFRTQPGNYLAFFSSFQYLRQVADATAAAHPEIAIWTQESRMSESERGAFLERFAEDGQGIGFAVLGGVFAEGVDLPGGRLIGAFVATLGLPQVNAVNEEMRARMEKLFGAGYDYAYFFPGLRKVVQAAGRVIRSETDRGVVYLIDDRFRQPRTAELLPRWWRSSASRFSGKTIGTITERE